MRRRVEAVQREVAPAPFQIFFREVEARHPRAGLGRTHGEAAGVGETIQNFKFQILNFKLKQRKIRRDVFVQKPPPVVALVEEQADGIAFAETHLVADAVLHNLKPLRRGFAEDELWRGFRCRRPAHFARKDFVIRAARFENLGEPRHLFILFCSQRRVRLREQKVAELFHEPARPAVARAMDDAEGVRRVRFDDSGTQILVGRASSRAGAGRKKNDIRFRAARGDARPTGLSVVVKTGWRGQFHRLAGGRMIKLNLRRVQKHPHRRRAAVKRVAENREAAFRRVDADLVRASGEGRGFNAVVAAVCDRRCC